MTAAENTADVKSELCLAPWENVRLRVASFFNTHATVSRRQQTAMFFHATRPAALLRAVLWTGS